MRLVDRVHARDQHEVHTLRVAMDAAEASLRAMEQLELDVIEGRRKDVRPPHMKPLREAWSKLHKRLLQHLDAEVLLYRHVSDWSAADGPLPDAIASAVAAARDDHVALQQLATPVQTAVVFLADVRSAFTHLLLTLETCHQIEEVELFPALDAGSRTLLDRNSTPAPAQWRTSDDVARTLRTNRPAPPREPEPPSGLLGRLKSWFGAT